jgi:hypothetical protein
MMVSFYSINFPALVSLLILVCVAIYHLWKGRKQEFTTSVLPSTAQFSVTETGISIRNEGDLSINTPMTSRSRRAGSSMTGTSARSTRSWRTRRS